MTEFKSDPITIETGDRNVYAFLSNLNNFEELMPEQVINWKSTETSCSFTIRGMADIALRIDKMEEYSIVSYVTDGKVPLNFNLNFEISGISEVSCKVQTVLMAQLNPMLQMMASRPLQNFVNLLVEKLKEVMETR